MIHRERIRRAWRVLRTGTGYTSAELETLKEFAFELGYMRGVQRQYEPAAAAGAEPALRVIRGGRA